MAREDAPCWYPHPVLIIMVSIMFISHVCYPCAFDESPITTLTDLKPIELYVPSQNFCNILCWTIQKTNSRSYKCRSTFFWMVIYILLKSLISKIILDSEEIGKILQKSHETFPCNHTVEWKPLLPFSLFMRALRKGPGKGTSGEGSGFKFFAASPATQQWMSQQQQF